MATLLQLRILPAGGASDKGFHVPFGPHGIGLHFDPTGRIVGRPSERYRFRRPAPSGAGQFTQRERNQGGYS